MSTTASTTTHRTQFDDQLLTESIGLPAPVCDNHGRHVRVMPDGSTLTALAWGGEAPTLRVWRDRVLTCEQILDGEPSAPCIDCQGRVWLSIAGRVHCDGRPICAGTLLDTDDDVLAVRRDDGLHLIRGGRDVLVRDQMNSASIEVDARGRVHVACERRWAIEYRRLNADLSAELSMELARPFGRFPVLACDGDRVLVAYLSEHVPVPADDAGFWADKPRERRIGLGGHIAAAVLDPNGAIHRHTLVATKHFAKPLWPKYPTFQYDYPNVDVRIRLDRFGPPALCRGGDGAIQVLWTNAARRWVFASRWLDGAFAPAAEVRGPFELLGTHVLTSRNAPGDVPLVTPVDGRAYLDQVRIAPAEVTRGRRIDFLQPDELASSRGFELVVNPLRKCEHNPVIRSGGLGSFDESGVAGSVALLPDGRWRADLLSKRHPLGWRLEQPAYSNDGVHFDRPGHIPDHLTVLIDGKPFRRSQTHMAHIEDPDEPDPRRRFKGLWQNDPEKTRWGSFNVVYSADGESWTTLPDDPVVPVGDGTYIWRDAFDIPQRRFKAISNARSFCGRICAQWVSADALHWRDVRDTLDFHNPFNADPYWYESYGDGRGTGRYLVDPWAGPDDEDEIHGGMVFRDGDRWLCHYMKWTYHGNILCALATSRDGINFTRVGGGAPSLPLGVPGEWDSGRIAIHSPPCLIDGTWRQYYVGSGWKHGMEGKGKRPHPTSGNVGPFSPNQIGLAQIEAGRWGHLQLRRDADEAELRTIPLQLGAAHRLTVDVEGLATPGARMQMAVHGAEVAGFGFDDCDAIGNGRRVNVTWCGRGLESLAGRTIRIAARITGMRVRFFGMDLHPPQADSRG